jgi:hypothetical protein
MESDVNENSLKTRFKVFKKSLKIWYVRKLMFYKEKIYARIVIFMV